MLTIGAAVCLIVTGCAGISGAPAPAGPTPTTSSSSRASSSSPSTVALSARDRAALTQLRHAASTSADVDGITGVDCWTPSEHLVRKAAAGTFSVLCRVRYNQETKHRYKDMTCIGDFYASPMLTHCYRWAYYSAEPRFEDGQRLASAPPTPFPAPTATPKR